MNSQNIKVLVVTRFVGRCSGGECLATGEYSEVMKGSLFLTTSLGKKLILPMLRLDALVLLRMMLTQMNTVVGRKCTKYVQ